METCIKYPRVLIMAGYGLNQVSGGGITLTNLFEGWPPDKLGILHADINGNTEGVVNHKFHLERKLVIPGSNIGIKWNTRDEITEFNTTQGRRQGNSIKHRAYFCLRTAVNKLIRRLGIIGITEKYVVSQTAIDFVNRFKPEVIYVHPGSISFAKLSIDIKRIFGTPLVVHVMDDYPSSLYTEGLFANMVSIHMNSLMKRLFAEASLCLGISLFMCSEYIKRYNMPFYCFHNPVNPVFLNDEPKKDLVPLEKNGKFRLVYVGRVGWGVAKALKDISEAVKDLAKNSIQLAIFANGAESVKQQYDFLISTPSNVTISESPKYADEIAKILHSADALVLPVEFDSGAIRAIRLSMPTKVPAYLSSGAPILLYGSEKIGFVTEAINEGWAYVVKVRSKQSLREAIEFLAENSVFRSKIVENALIKAKSFESGFVREAFRQALSKAAIGQIGL